MEVSIIIPNYNGRKLLEDNLPFVLGAAQNKKNKIAEIIIIDDKSLDDSLEVLKLFKKQIKIVKHTKNRGFSATVNTGARAAKSPLLCLLNTDVKPSEDFLEHAVPHFQDKKVFGVTLHEEGYGPAIGKFVHGFIEHENGVESNSAQNTFWISGGSGVFRRSMWMSLGGMNEALYSPFYWEDVDMGYMAHKRGWKLLWEPRAYVLHEHEGTIGKTKKSYKQLIQERNQLLLIWKNITSNNLKKKHRQGLMSRVRQHPGYLRIVIAALMKYNQVTRYHKKEVKESVVSDEAIFEKFS
jgi:O-antigen biosynthesis protein